ncbi:Golgi to ER traffic- protein [Pestalotiopsis sp. IQ-011]
MPLRRLWSADTTALPTLEEEEVSNETDFGASLTSYYEPFEKRLTKEDKELIDFLVAVCEKDSNAAGLEVSNSADMEADADSDHSGQQPNVQSEPKNDDEGDTQHHRAQPRRINGTKHLLELVRASVLELQAGGTPNETDLVDAICQWVAKLDEPGLIPVAESAPFKTLADVLGKVAIRCRGMQDQQCIRCGEMFTEDSNGWSCKKFLDNHHNGRGRLEVYPLAPCWTGDDEHAEKLMGIDFGLLKPEISQRNPDGFRWNCCGKNVIASGCGMLKHVSS